MNEKKIYVARKGSLFTNEKAQVYGEYLDKLMNEKKELSPSEIVENAKSETSPIHDYFEWNNGIAANKYREWQARQLVKSIEIVVTRKGSAEPFTVNAFENVKNIDADKKVYVSVETILKTEEYRKQVLAEAIKEANRWMEKFHDYEELISIFDAIEKTRKKFDAHHS